MDDVEHDQCEECLSYDCDCAKFTKPELSKWTGDAKLMALLREHGFRVEDTSWSNDECASIRVGYGEHAVDARLDPKFRWFAQVFIDAIARHRRCGDERFAVCQSDDDGVAINDAAERTDDREVVLQAIQTLKGYRLEWEKKQESER
jgi:hypothetical protein